MRINGFFFQHIRVPLSQAQSFPTIPFQLVCVSGEVKCPPFVGYPTFATCTVISVSFHHLYRIHAGHLLYHIHAVMSVSHCCLQVSIYPNLCKPWSLSRYKNTLSSGPIPMLFRSARVFCTSNSLHMDEDP